MAHTRRGGRRTSDGRGHRHSTTMNQHHKYDHHHRGRRHRQARSVCVHETRASKHNVVLGRLAVSLPHTDECLSCTQTTPGYDIAYTLPPTTRYASTLPCESIELCPHVKQWPDR